MSDIVAKATAALEQMLAQTGYAAGTRLPPERALAQRLGLSRASLRKALDGLERRGRIRRHVGRGTFVAQPARGSVEATLTLSPPPGPADVLELRQMIEPQIAAAAALRATEPQIADLRRLAEAGAAATGWSEWEALDVRFHAALAACTRNPLVAGVLDTLQLIRQGEDWGALRRRALDPARQAAFADHHAALVAHIAARDAAAAAAAMRDHLDAVHRTMTVAADLPDAAPPNPDRRPR